jgi:hypothetical protein
VMSCDRFYDMGLHCLFSGEVLALCNCAACNAMRRGGLEPPSLAAPDPKSHPRSKKLAVAQGGVVAEQRSAPLINAQSTTDFTTYPAPTSRVRFGHDDSSARCSV